MVEQLPLEAPINDENRFYMKTKAEKMGHKYETDPDASLSDSSNDGLSD